MNNRFFCHNFDDVVHISMNSAMANLLKEFLKENRRPDDVHLVALERALRKNINAILGRTEKDVGR